MRFLVVSGADRAPYSRARIGQVQQTAFLPVRPGGVTRLHPSRGAAPGIVSGKRHCGTLLHAPPAARRKPPAPTVGVVSAGGRQWGKMPNPTR